MEGYFQTLSLALTPVHCSRQTGSLSGPESHHRYLLSYQLRSTILKPFIAFPLALFAQVIRGLLRKVNAIDEPSRFALFVVKDNGEVKQIMNDDSPMQRRLQLGPKEDLAKLWIMEATEAAAVSLSADVAQYYNLSMPFLHSLVERFKEEEERLIQKVREKYVLEREFITELIEVIEGEEEDEDGGSLV